MVRVAVAFCMLMIGNINATEQYSIQIIPQEKNTSVSKDDVADLIQVLENQQKRENLLKQLKTLQKTKEAQETPLTTQKIIENLIQTFEVYASKIVNLIPLLVQSFCDVIKTFCYLYTDHNYIDFIYILIGLSSVVSGAFLIEKIVKFLAKNTILNNYEIIFTLLFSLSSFVLYGFLIPLLKTITFYQVSYLQYFVITITCLRLIFSSLKTVHYLYKNELSQQEKYLVFYHQFLRYSYFSSFCYGLITLLSTLNMDEKSVNILFSVFMFMNFVIILKLVFHSRKLIKEYMILLSEKIKIIEKSHKVFLFIENKFFPIFVILFTLFYINTLNDTFHNFPNYLLKTFYILFALTISFILVDKIDLFMKNILEKMKDNQKNNFLNNIINIYNPILDYSFLLSYLFLFIILLSTSLFPHLYKPLFFRSFLLKLITISVIVLIARLLWSAIDYLLQNKSDTLVSADRNKMLVKSIYPTIRRVLRAALVFITGILMLAELGYQLLPLFFSLGFFGLAVSFGAQSLVKDLINGMIILTENNIAIEDVVQIGQYVGTIEKISLRSLFLRHANGSLQSIPFSEVHNIINKSRDYTSFLVDLSVGYGSDLTKIYKILKETSDEMAKDPTFSNIMVEDIKIFGIDRFTENAVHVTALIKTVPDPRNYFGREFNYRLKQKLDKEGLFAPAYHQLVEIVYQDETKRVAQTSFRTHFG